LTQSEPQVLQQILDPGESALLAIDLPRLLHTAKADQRPPPRFFFAEPGMDPVFSVQSNVAFEFRGEVVICLAHAEHAGQPRP
jgi:hypothetical protein